jgi:hypothetical protein
LAASVGLDTLEGLKYLDMATKLDARAERLGVTALDIAERLHKAEPKQDPLAWLTGPAPTPTKTLPTAIASPDAKPPSERDVVPANDKVDGPTNEGAT